MKFQKNNFIYNLLEYTIPELNLKKYYIYKKYKVFLYIHSTVHKYYRVIQCQINQFQNKI